MKTEYTRVDRWIQNAKNHPWIAGPFFVAIVIMALSTLTDSAKRLFQTWDNLRHPSNDVLIEPLVEWQPPFDIDPRIHFPAIDGSKTGSGPELDTNWVILLGLTNLTEHPVVMEDLRVDFSADSGSGWRLIGKDVGLDTYVSDTEDSYGPDENVLDKTFRPGSIILHPGSKRFFAFRLFFDLYRGEQRAVLTDMSTARRAVLLAVGGDIDNDGKCRDVIGPVNGTFVFASGEAPFKIKTDLSLPGCQISSIVK